MKSKETPKKNELISIEETILKRHEVRLTADELSDYEKACSHPDITRKPTEQTLFLIRQFIKERKN